MKKEIAVTERPEIFTEQYLAAFGNMSWYDFVTAMPSLVFVVTGWKSNGKEKQAGQIREKCLPAFLVFLCGKRGRQLYLYPGKSQ